MLYMNNEKSLPTVFLLCLAMYKVKCELSMAGSGGNGDTAQYTGMDNYNYDTLYNIFLLYIFYLIS